MAPAPQIDTLSPLLWMLGPEFERAIRAAHERTGDTTIICRCASEIWSVERGEHEVHRTADPAEAVAFVDAITA